VDGVGLVRSLGGRGGRVDLDVTRLELGPKLDEVFVVEVVLERERLEGGFVDRAVVLGVVEELVNRCFENGVQVLLLPSSRSAASGAATALEALDPAAARDLAFRSGVRGVAVRAGVDDQLAPSRAGRECVAARCAADGCEHQLGMNLLQKNSPPSDRGAQPTEPYALA
jgi:hypothetical protein